MTQVCSLFAKVSFFAFFIILILKTAYGATPKENLIKQSEAFASLINERKYKEVAYKMHPLIVISMGGISQTTEAITESFSALHSGDNNFKGLKFKLPDSIVKVREDLVAIVNYESKIQVKDDLYQIDSFYIAWSSDNGDKWYFADGSGFKGSKSLEFLFPDYNNELTIPPTKKPYKIKNTVQFERLIPSF